MFYQKQLAIRTYTKKTSLKHNQGCEVMLKQTNLATTLQQQNFHNWFDKVVNTMEYVQ